MHIKHLLVRVHPWMQGLRIRYGIRKMVFGKKTESQKEKNGTG
jgi:hypothetical protein